MTWTIVFFTLRYNPKLHSPYQLHSRHISGQKIRNLDAKIRNINRLKEKYFYTIFTKKKVCERQKQAQVNYEQNANYFVSFMIR